MSEIYGQRIQTTVQTNFLPYFVDTVLGSNVLFQRLVRGAKKWSGRKLEVPIKYKKNETGQSVRGFDTISVAATDNRIKAEFFPSFYTITVALSNDELAVADTEDKVIDLMQAEIQGSCEDMADDLGDIVYGDGTGNSSKNPLGLGALVDDGDNVASIGGLSRSTYDTLQSTVTASGGTLSLAKMATLYTAVSSGTQTPTAFFTTEAVWNLYEQLLQPQERITKTAGTVKGMKGGTGFTALDYKGKPVLADEKCTSGYFYALNENYIDFYALPSFNAKPIAYKSQIEGNDYNAPVGLGFSWTDWIIPANSLSVIGHIIFGGQFTTTNPKRSGVLTGVTGT
ncbi:phage major capsid protein [bacterium]|nr:MAG: phage major capsid protein [bacterium]